MLNSLRRYFMFYTPDDNGGGTGSGSGSGGSESGAGGSRIGSGTGSDAGNNNNSGGSNTGGGAGGSGAAFTQADVDRIVKERLARQEATLKQQFEESKRREQMDEVERAKAEAAEHKERADKAITQRDAAAISAEVRVMALAAGVKAERLSAFQKLVETDCITVSEEGVVDSKAVKAAVDAVLKEMPELVGKAGSGKGGSDMNNGGSQESELTEEIINKMSHEELKKRMPEIQAFYANRKG